MKLTTNFHDRPVSRFSCFYSRMEVTLPRTWFQSINRAGQKLSATIFRGNNYDQTLNSNNYDLKKTDPTEYIKYLQHMSQNQLIQKILMHEKILTK